MFKTIPGFPDYKVNEYGDVISYKRKNPRLLKPTVCNKGKSLIVSLKDENNKSYSVTIAYLIALAFIPNSDEKRPFVCMIDGASKRMHVSNLYWSDQKRNGKAMCRIDANGFPIIIFESASRSCYHPKHNYNMLKHPLTNGERTTYLDDYFDMLKEDITNEKTEVQNLHHHS